MRIVAIKKSPTLREQVFDAVLTELRHGQFPPGTRITEEALARRLDVSRTPIREALGQLTRQGVLQIRPGGGYVVPSHTAEELRHIIVVRTLLEPVALRMAAEEYSNVQIERISAAIRSEAATVRKADPAPFARGNEEFRQAVFDGLANRALSGLIKQFDSHLHFIRAVTLRDSNLRAQIVERQTRIRDALQRRDPDRAESLWRSYLKFTESVLTQTLFELNRTATVDEESL